MEGDIEREGETETVRDGEGGRERGRERGERAREWAVWEKAVGRERG